MQALFGVVVAPRAVFSEILLVWTNVETPGLPRAGRGKGGGRKPRQPLGKLPAYLGDSAGPPPRSSSGGFAADAQSERTPAPKTGLARFQSGPPNFAFVAVGWPQAGRADQSNYWGCPHNFQRELRRRKVFAQTFSNCKASVQCAFPKTFQQASVLETM
jgi:hypothetical protein